MEDSMAVMGASNAGGIGGVPASRTRSIAYWGCTLFIALAAIGAGALDLLRAPPLFDLLRHLGYPPHFATVLGTWKVLGAVALLWPRRPLLKEWAYAGMFFDYTGAIAAHASAGDSFGAILGPVLSLVALVASWYLRPRSRRLAETYARA